MKTKIKGEKKCQIQHNQYYQDHDHQHLQTNLQQHQTPITHHKDQQQPQTQFTTQQFDLSQSYLTLNNIKPQTAF